MQDRIFYASCFGFTLGVLWRSFIALNFYLSLTFGLIAFFLFLYFYFISNNKWGVVVFFFILIFTLGAARFHLVDESFSESAAVLESQVGEKVELTGFVVDEPIKTEITQKAVIKLDRRDADIKILATLGLYEDIKYGDEVKFSGKLKKPENFQTDQGKEFDYVNYLRKDGIYYVMNYVTAEVVSQGHGNFIQSKLFSLKEIFLEKINSAIQAPESLLLAGLILGEKASFSQALRESFVNTGTIHIVALSGYNVTIVAVWFMKFLSYFKFLPQNFGIGMGIFAIFLFILMTGGSTTGIRAGIMASLALVARATGRNYDVARALTLALVVMVLINPFVLVYDVSFQLSFIATVAVIFLAPRIEKHFHWLTQSFGLREVATTTFAAYIFVLPFILYNMGNLSLVALPANILILPFIPATMLIGFLAGFIGLLSYTLSVPLGFISYLFLHYELSVINFFSHIPFASLSFPNFPLILTIAIYAYFIYKLFGRSIKSFFTEPF